MATPVPIEDMPTVAPMMVPDSDLPEEGILKKIGKKHTDIVRGVGEGLLSTATGLVATPIAGLAGFGHSMVSGLEAGANTVEKVADALTYKPQTEYGQKAPEVINFVSGMEGLSTLSKMAGSGVHKLTGWPVAGAAAETAVMGAPMLLDPLLRRGTNWTVKPKAKVMPKEVPVEDIPVEAVKPKVEPIKVAVEVPKELTSAQTKLQQYEGKDIYKMPKEDLQAYLDAVRERKAELAETIKARDTKIVPTEDLPVEIAKPQGDVTLHSNPLQAIGKAYEEHIGAPIYNKLSTFIPDTLKEFVNPTSTLKGGEEYLSLRSEARGFIRRAEDFMGKEFDKLKTLPEESRAKIFRAIVPDGGVEMSSLSPREQFLAKQIIRTNDRIGQMLVKEGVLTPEQFAQNQGGYVHYQYLKHILGDDYNIPTVGGKIDTSILKSRKDLTMEQRRAIGLIEDIATAEPTGMFKGLKDYGMNKFFDKILANPDWTWQPGIVDLEGKKISIGSLAEELNIQKRVVETNPTPEAQARLTTLQDAMTEAQKASGNVLEGYYKMPDSKSWGPLAGQYVRQEIAHDLMPPTLRTSKVTAGGHAFNYALDLAENAMSIFKISKTAVNVPTVVRNGVSNILQLNMSGMPLYEMPLWMMDAAKKWGRSPEYITAKRAGLFEGNFGTGELKEVYNLIKKHSPDGKFDLMGFAHSVGKFYGKIDDFYKFAKYLEQTGKGIDAKTAMREAQKWGMDYSLASNTVKAVRRSIIPFASYQYKIAPLIVESLTKRPWVVAKYAAIPYAMFQLSREALHITDDEWKQLRRQLPMFIKQNRTYSILPWKSPEGNVQWVNLEYFLPWQQYLALARDISGGKYGEVVSDLGVGNPLMDLYTVAKTTQNDNPPKDPFTGRDIYNKLDNPAEKAIKTAEWIYNKWSPTMLTRQGAIGDTVASIVRSQDRQGRRVSPVRAGLKWVGVNVISPTQSQAYREKRAMIAELKASLSKIVKDPTVSNSKKVRARKEFQARLKEIQGGTE